MVLWIWVAVLVIAVIVLAASVASLLGRLSRLRRAVRELQLRQAEAERVRQSATAVEPSLAAVQLRADEALRRAAAIRERVARR